MKITLYSKTGCPKCLILKKKLDAEGVVYEEKNDSVDKMLAMGFKEAPVLEINMGYAEAVNWIKERKEQSR